MVALAVALTAAGCGGGEESPRRESDVESQIKEKLAENRKALPNDKSSQAAVSKRSVEEFVRLYQRLGFFENERPEDVVSRLDRAYRRDWGEEPRIRTRLDELALLGYGSHRVWFQDIERDVIEGNDEYALTLREWARISRGAFAPRRIREQWRSEEGPVTISFDLNGRARAVRAESQGDFLDLCVLTTGINPLIAKSGRQFAIYRPDAELGQMAFVLTITDRERRLLNKQGWVFAGPDEVRFAFGYGQLYEGGQVAPCE
ncbi:MAG: hypothetical protein QOI62_360 [Solirubrobacteraceae bacterium]|nr:hypothetical protein [Solirubrobacteraceae bacterium]